MTLLRRFALVPATPATPCESIDPPRQTEAYRETTPGAEASKPSIPPEIHQAFVKGVSEHGLHRDRLRSVRGREDDDGPGRGIRHPHEDAESRPEGTRGPSDGGHLRLDGHVGLRPRGSLTSDDIPPRGDDPERRESGSVFEPAGPPGSPASVRADNGSAPAAAYPPGEPHPIGPPPTFVRRPQPPGESAALLSESSLSQPIRQEDPGGPRSAVGVDHPAFGGESAGPFPSHHHRFYSIVVNGKIRSMPCDVPVDDGRGHAVPCGLTWEENVEMAITRYDRAARREGGR